MKQSVTIQVEVDEQISIEHIQNSVMDALCFSDNVTQAERDLIQQFLNFLQVNLNTSLFRHWVLAFGNDCDGYNSGRVYEFYSLSEANDFAYSLNTGSDGLRYNVTSSLNDVIDYKKQFKLK